MTTYKKLLPFQSSAQKAELSSIGIRDFAYRKLIEIAPAEECKEINDREKGLRARKFFDFENYGIFPRKQGLRRDLAIEIR